MSGDHDERIHTLEMRLGALETDAGRIHERLNQLYVAKDGLQEQLNGLAEQVHQALHPNVVEISPGHVEVDGKRYTLEEEAG